MIVLWGCSVTFGLRSGLRGIKRCPHCTFGIGPGRSPLRAPAWCESIRLPEGIVATPVERRRPGYVAKNWPSLCRSRGGARFPPRVSEPLSWIGTDVFGSGGLARHVVRAVGLHDRSGHCASHRAHPHRPARAVMLCRRDRTAVGMGAGTLRSDRLDSRRGQYGGDGVHLRALVRWLQRCGFRPDASGGVRIFGISNPDRYVFNFRTDYDRQLPDRASICA